MSFTIKSYVEELSKKEVQLVSQLKKVRAAIQSAQEVCEHDYKFKYHTHKNIDECTICRHQISS